MSAIDTLYEKYSIHIELLRKELIIKETNNYYVCPICLKKFSKNQISDLSLEDAPQFSLGGSKIAITCKSCNNSCGHVIDKHLVNYIKRLDEKNYVEDSIRRVRISHNGGNINADLKVHNNQLNIILPIKINNPQLLEEHITSTNEGDVIEFKDIPVNIDVKKVSTAI